MPQREKGAMEQGMRFVIERPKKNPQVPDFSRLAD